MERLINLPLLSRNVSALSFPSSYTNLVIGKFQQRRLNHCYSKSS
jgi:hypothetical protein